MPAKVFPFSKQSYVDILLIGDFNAKVNNSVLPGLSILIVKKCLSQSSFKHIVSDGQI